MSESDARLAELVEEWTDRLQAGEPVDISACVRKHPEYGPQLRELLPAVQMLAEVGSAAESSRRGGAASHQSGIAGEPVTGVLGDFRIVREIGRGGMGIVYEAEQISLGRKVALKVLPFAAALDAKHLQRFINEAQAAAHLHHTNIVPVYAVGADRGLHFYAMQLIEGQNLAAVIADLRTHRSSSDSGLRNGGDDGPAPTGAPGKSETSISVLAQLPTERSDRSGSFFRTIARLTAQAAEGLDYAHELGIVHRDVKPANLLVDRRGNVWITDFGLAQVHADTALTQTGDLLGTLRYMSPEQADGQRTLIDPRADVYSLGATLYELLTLRPIFDGTNRQRLLYQIAHDEPRPPRSWDRSIPSELETIVLKAVAKVPAERYASARALADDLQRFLRHEPIRARRPTLAHRARKWLRRHPAMLGVGAVLLALVAVGSFISARLIEAEQEKTRQSYERERQRAEEAEERFQLARRSVDELIQLAEEELGARPNLQWLRKRMLMAALAYYQELIDRRRNDPEARAELAVTRDGVQKILHELALLQASGHLYLLNVPDVLVDLGVTGRQQARLTEVSQCLGEHWLSTSRAYHRMGRDERHQLFLDLAEANEAAIGGILDARQLRRLKQVALQLQGPMAFREPDVAVALKLTAHQKQQIYGIERKTFFARWDWARTGSPQSRYLEKVKASMNKIQGLLTDEQAKQWQEMAGAPFEGQASFQGRMPPPPRISRRP
jgi:serine/threonine protein kinase